ncbi:MAG TPA: DUF1343 domain-containing protein, partial [Firmicutes bacterium]|nr:DUF1343 domain-containing protein [Bacillota bacterium]
MIIAAFACSEEAWAKPGRTSWYDPCEKAPKAVGKVKVRLGNEVFLEKHLEWVRGKRVGLITNPTGVNSELVSTIDILMEHPEVNLVALFGPEHGVRGNYAGGRAVEDA